MFFFAAQHAMNRKHDYYYLLDVPRNATDAEIRRAFRALAKEHHPDSPTAKRKGEPGWRDFLLISEAYETLKDPERRAAYDRHLDDGVQLPANLSKWPGQRFFVMGLGLGLLLAIVAVSAVRYVGHMDSFIEGKAQDSLKNVIIADGDEPQSAPSPNATWETGSTAALPPARKKPSTAVSLASSTVSPAPAAQAHTSAPSVPDEASAKLDEPVAPSAAIASAEPLDIVIGSPGHKRTVRVQPGKGLTQTFSDCASCPEMVVVPQGQTVMGARSNENRDHLEETPAHRVHIAKALAISKNVISEGHWRACVDAGFCHFSLSSLLAAAPRMAATRMSWLDAKAYVAWLSQTTGARYRLLSEAEWEYAARAGKGRGPMEQEVTGQYATDTAGLFPRVRFGHFAAAGPNAWGIQGGGVFEWVEDCWHGTYAQAPGDASPWLASGGGDCTFHVIRGVANSEGGLGWRPSARGRQYVQARSPTLGFRVAREIAVPAKTALENDPSRRHP